ncbi:MAG: branched-chain amino acid ABC transporter substrate-binding protein [Arcobacter sp.]|nr:branched-chain amino acid ABC transporter substrate-binding protein [Arcobacter sp.]|tara:strand:- start:8163 stop:9311 length:1149 start_codon:yes stop_codon:yes gene_type:complete
MKIVLFITLLFSFIKADILETDILYLEQKIQRPPVLSNVIKTPEDLGIQGAKIAVKDSNKTARFLNQKYNLIESISFDKKKLLNSLEKFINEKNSFVLLKVEDNLLQEIIKNPLFEKAVFFNVANKNSDFRQNLCQTNLLHTIASNAMLYDGLVQFLVKRNFKDIFLISGTKEKDLQITKDIKRAVKKFNAKIVEEKQWTYDADIRRKAADEMPVFTQANDYDVIITADNYGDFGEFVYFNSWLPRPLAGTQGLTPKTWHKVIEQWGAAQMQKRFEKFASRWMEDEDFAAWVAIRTIVTSVTKTKSNDMKTALNFIYSKDFELGAYKGRKLTYRDFNGQIRMPVALVQPNALVSTSPQVGFLHPTNDLDTLGIASFQVECKK